MDLEISDEMLGTFAPLLVYWIYSGFYVVLGLFAEDYRLHTKQDEDEKNLVSKFDVVKGVLLQQAVQAVVATLLFAVSFLVFLYLYVFSQVDIIIKSFHIAKTAL
jgi:sphinganine C4-monooxygenase